MLCGIAAHVILDLCARYSQPAHRRAHLTTGDEQLSARARGRSCTTSTTLYPLGPFHPALPQPLALTLRLRGDLVTSIERGPEGYCRRGIEALALGMPPADALELLRHSCGFAGAANTLAFARAVEAATGCDVPPAGERTRVLLLEVERILARLWLLGQAATAATQPTLAAQALEQREALFTALEAVTGQRAYWPSVILGGATLSAQPDLLREPLEAIEHGLSAWKTAINPRGAIGRVATGAGALSAANVEAAHLAGVAAGGVAADVRRTAPSAGYAALEITWPDQSPPESIDTTARLAYAIEDLTASVTIARACLDQEDGNGKRTRALDLKRATAGQEHTATVEGPHGPVTATVALSARGTVQALRLETPVAPTVAALAEILEGTPMASVPLILASLDLCPECLDR